MPTKYKFKPSAGRIAVKVEQREAQGGIILIGDSHNPKPTVGTVSEVCDQYELDDEDYDPLYKVGDIVIFGKFTGTKVQVDRDIYIVLRESEILARLIPDDTGAVDDVRKVKIADGVADDPI